MTPEREAEIRDQLIWLNDAKRIDLADFLNVRRYAEELSIALQAERERADAAEARIATLEAALKAATEYRAIETAPSDQTVLVFTRGGDVLPAELSDGYVDGNDLPVSCWAATQEHHPPSWTDGACWASNGDDEESDPPTHWLPLPTPPAGGAHG